MKYSCCIFGFLLFIFASCGNRPDRNGSSKKESEATPATSESAGTSGSDDLREDLQPSAGDSGNNQFVVWIGMAARWRKAPGVVFDGFYDSTIGYFKPCGQDRTYPVVRDFIDLEDISNCDTSTAGHVSLMMKNLDSQSIPGGGHLLPVTEIVADKAVIARNSGTDSVRLSQPALLRIRRYHAARVLENNNTAELKK
jgi:hypothetical protein